jgi:hypothetical protein
LHRKGINDIILSHWGLKRKSYEVMTLDICEARVFSELLGHLLESEVASRAVRTNEEFIILHLKKTVLTLSAKPSMSALQARYS